MAAITEQECYENEIQAWGIERWSLSGSCLDDWCVPRRSIRLVSPTNGADALFADHASRARLLLTPILDGETESAQGVAPDTLHRALEFLKRYYSHFRGLSIEMPLPNIDRGPDHSVDLHWDRPSFELLINIPPGNRFAEFYGDDRGAMQIRGTFDPSVVNSGMVEWLTRVKA